MSSNFSYSGVSLNFLPSAPALGEEDHVGFIPNNLSTRDINCPSSRAVSVSHIPSTILFVSLSMCSNVTSSRSFDFSYADFVGTSED